MAQTVEEKIENGDYRPKTRWSPGNRTAYNAEIEAIRQTFRADLEAEYGVTGHPKAELLWTIAWDRGHADGLGPVYAAYDTLVELIK